MLTNSIQIGLNDLSSDEGLDPTENHKINIKDIFSLLMLLLSASLLAGCGGDSRSKIAFVTGDYSGGEVDIWVMNVGGTDQTRLTSKDGIEWVPCWSPDNDKIAFVVGNEISTGDVWLMNSDGTNQVRLTHSKGVTLTSGCWSPDGKKIVFGNDNGIYVMDSEGTIEDRVIKATILRSSHPFWSPDGEKIFFSSNRDGSVETYSVLANGTDITRLPHNEENEVWHTPCLSSSPDGKNLVCGDGRGDGKISIVSLDVGMRINLTSETQPNLEVWPDWSPDGEQIIYTVVDGGDSGKYNLFIMNSDGTQKTMLISRPQSGFATWSNK